VSGPDARVRTLALAMLAVCPGALLAAWQAAANWPFFSDDSFISLRFAQRLLDGKGLTWTDGERVEGYSNLLWVLATAGLGACGVDLVTAARGLGALCTLLAQWCLVRALPPRDVAGAVRAAAGPLLVAAGAPMMTWTLGGLEGPMVLLWLAWGGARLVRAFAATDGGAPPTPHALCLASLPFALLCLTRPDGPLWTAAVAAVLGAALLRAGPGTALRRTLAFAALPVALTLAQLLFRLAYYGELVPNTAHVKVDLGGVMLQAGLEHTGHSLFVLLGNLAPGALGAAVAFREPRRRTPVLALAAACIAWTVYVTAVGGDHFPGYRLWHGVLAPLALLAVLGLDALPRRLPGRTAWPAQLTGALAVLVGVAVSLLVARRDFLGTYARGETWEQDGRTLGEALHAAFAREQPRLAVDAAGALPFYSRLPALDMLGLCDRTIATSPPPPFLAAALAASGLTSLPGHMRGNGRYVMDCAPDLVSFANPPGQPLAVFASGLGFEDDARWRDGYRCAVLELAGSRPMQAPLWFRIDGRAGVRRRDDRVEVPALLLGAYRQPRAFRMYAQPAPGTPERAAWQTDLDAATHWFTGERFVAAVPAADGALELELRADQAAALDLALAPGRWRIEPDRPVALDLALRGDGVTAADGVFTVAGEGPRRVGLVAVPRRGAPLPLRLRTVALVRMP
jgi:hypothetical protein